MSAIAAQMHDRVSPLADEPKFRTEVQSNDPQVLADIYRDEVNMVIWQRDLSAAIQQSVADFVASNRSFHTALTVSPQNAFSNVDEAMGTGILPKLSENIAELVELFCCLFELKQAGLRLTALDHAMCPRFHVDRVPCRLVTTYQGVATEWLSHQAVDRSKLGLGNNGQPDAQSGVYQQHSDIRQLACGDVALLKGEDWQGNSGAGLVHRSPMPGVCENRLLLTLDFIR